MLNVKTKNGDYPIYIKNSFNGLADAFKRVGLCRRKIMIITDSNVEKLYLSKIKGIASQFSDEVYECVFEAGEKSKALDTISYFYDNMIKCKLDRKSVVVALGGGVAGDMAGFAAATYMRGISYVQIPTTLLAQIDSSVGGKTGVDFDGHKNMVGAFYQPKFVYINIETLKTLDKLQFSAGMAEAVKHGYIADENYLNMIKENKESINALNSNAIEQLVYGSCLIKSAVVSRDEKETGLREILNFGHTFGHAVESLSGFSLLHGECVAIGICAAVYLSSEINGIDKSEIEKAEELLKYFDLPVRVTDFNAENIFNQMFYDKKAKDNKLNIVLLSAIGKAYTDKSIDYELIKKAVKHITA